MYLCRLQINWDYKKKIFIARSCNLTKAGFTAGLSAFTSAKRIEVKVKWAWSI
jgi:hypothetical protein